MSGTLIDDPVQPSLESPRTERRKPARRKSARRSRGIVVRLLLPLAWGLAIGDILLFVWMLLASLKTTREMTFKPFSWPSHWLYSNFREAWVAADFKSGFVNSLILVIGSGIGCIALAAPAAYALSRIKVRGSGPIMVFFVMGLGIPTQAMFIPLYVMFDRLNLVNSIWGLMLIYIGSGIPFALFLLTAFFHSLPRELEEAAVIDGAGPLRVFTKIMLPLTRSGLITIFVLQAISNWGETFFALVMLQDKTTLSLALYRFLNTMQYTGARYSVLFAGLIITIAPLLILYIFLGKRIIEGIAAGYSR